MSIAGYDPIPDLAKILAGLQVARSISGGHVLGAAREPYDALRHELGLFGWPDAAEHEQRLRKHLTVLNAGPGADRKQSFVTNPDGVNECAVCHMPMVDGVIAHKLDCRGMWNDPGPRS